MKNRIEHGYLKSISPVKMTSHPSIILNITQNYSPTSDSIEYKFTDKSPNNIIEVTQTSNYYKNKDKLTCVSHTNYNQDNINTTHPKVTSVHFGPKIGYTFHPKPPTTYIPNTLIGDATSTGVVWEMSGISKADLITSVLTNSEYTNSIVCNLEENSIPINYQTQLKNYLST